MEFKLLEHSQLCQSQKKTERKRGVVGLKDLLSEDSAIACLNRNNPLDQVSWNELFKCAHRALILESECWKVEDANKAASSTVVSNRENAKRLFSSLADVVLQKANASKPNVDFSEIVEACFRVFSDRYLMKVCGDVYFNIMQKNVLTVRKYRNTFTSSDWDKLFYHILGFLDLERELKGGFYYQAIDLMNSVITYCSHQSQLCLQVKSKLLPLLEVKFLTFYDQASLQEVLLKLALNTCALAANESRTGVCHFGELILPAVLKTFKQKDKSLSSKLIIDFLLIQVQCHHPDGAKQDSGAAYACDWKKWTHYMHVMYRIVIDTISRNERNRLDPLSENFLDLSVELFYHILDKTKQPFDISFTMNETEDMDAGPAVKRRKWMTSTEELFDELKSCKGSGWPILVLKILKKYPNLFQDVDLLKLMEIMSEIQSNCQNQETLKHVNMCCGQLLKVLNKKKLSSDILLKVWDTTLRSASSTHSEIHNLLQTFMSEKAAPMSGLLALLRMFQRRIFQLSDATVKTLSILLTCYHIPESSVSLNADPWEMPITSARLVLLDWLFSFGSDAVLEPKLTSKVLVGLTLRVRHDACPKTTSGSASSIGLKRVSFQQNYTVSAFEDTLLLPLNLKDSSQTPHENSNRLSSCVIDLASKDKLENLMNAKCLEIERKVSELSEQLHQTTSVAVVKLRKLRVLLTLELIDFSTLLVNVVSNLLEFCVVTNDTLKDYPMYKLLVKSMKHLSVILPKVLEVDGFCVGSDEELKNVLKVLQSLKRLYGSDLMSYLSNQLCELTDKSILVALVSFLYSLSNENQNLDILNHEAEIFYPEDIFNGCYVTNADNLRFLCVGALTSFSCLKLENLHGKQISVIQRIIKVLSENDVCDLSKESTFLLVYYSLSSLLSCSHLDQEKHLQPIIHLLKSVCKQWKNDAVASSHIMHLLRDLFKHAAVEGRRWERAACLVLLAPFRNMTYGPKFTIQYISCFYELLKIDMDSEWARWATPLNLSDVLECDTIPPRALRKFEDGNKNTAVIEDVLYHLLSPFHEVRLMAVPIVSNLFCGEHHNTIWMETMFARLTLILYELFIVKGDDMPREEIIDEGANRTSTVLHVLASIQASSSKCQLWALRLMFSLMKEKHLDKDLIKKVFKSLAITMNLPNIHSFLEKSLSFILNEWLLWRYQLQDFPFNLLNVSTFSDFFNKYNKIILPVILKNKNSAPALNTICQDLECSPTHLLKISFSSVYAQYLAFSVKTTSDAKAACIQYESFFSTVDSEEIRNLVATQIDEILFEITCQVWDPSHHETLLGLEHTKIQAMVPFISIEEYSSAFKHLQKTITTDLDLLMYVAGQQPDIIQKVLLRLREEISMSITMNQRVKGLHNYCAFVHAIASRLGKGEFPSTEEFLLSDITHTLLYVIQENKSNHIMIDVCIGSCCFLYILYQHILPACASILKNLLPTVIGCLIPLAMDVGVLAENSLKVIKLLVITHSTCLGDAIGCLPPFPDSPKFVEMRKVHSEMKYRGNNFSLKEEIEHFLTSSSASNTVVNQNSMFDGLNFLRKELCEKKIELLHLYQDLKQGRGSSQDCKESIIHQLICKLIYIMSTANEKVQMEAMRCLGELGPTDLTTLVLKPVEGGINLISGYSDPVLCVMALAAQILSEYLLHHSITVVKSASKTLLNIMSCQKSNVFHSTKSSSKCIDSKKISPFIQKEPVKPIPLLTSDTNKLTNLLADDDIWFPSSGIQHDQWISRLASSLFCSLSSDDIFKDFASLCEVKTSFAEEMLPVLFYLGLSCSMEVGDQLCARLAQFFENHFNAVCLANNTKLLDQDSNSIHLSKPSVQCMLNVVNFMRLKEEEERKKGILLKINYLHVASAAQYCSAYLSSIMFLELWCNGESRSLDYDGSGTPYIDFIFEREELSGKVLQKLLMKAYEQIGDKDAIYGCGSSILLDPRARVREYEHAGMWDKVLLDYDVKLSCSKNENGIKGLVSALLNSRLYHILNTFVESQPSEQREEFFSAQTECMWRLGQWNTPLSLDTNVKSFEWSQYSALQAVSDKNMSRAHECITEGRLFVLENLAHSSLENCKNIYKPMTQLQVLQRTQEWYEYILKPHYQEIEDFVNTDDMNKLWNKWKKQDILPYNDICLLEIIKAQRTTLLHIALKQKNNQNGNHNMSSDIFQSLTENYLETADLARKEGQIQLAERWLRSLSSIPNLCEEDIKKLRLQEAQLAWSSTKGEGTNSIARNLLRSFIKDVQVSEKESKTRSKLHPQALILYGKWMAETRSENPQQIIDDYLEEALLLLNDLPPHSSIQEQLEAHSCLAHFADLEYQRITEYIKSETFQKKVKCMEVLRNESSLTVEKGNREQTSAVNFNRNYSVLDENEIKTTYKDQDQFLQQALRHYLTSMKLGEGTNIHVFRMVSLWLENSNKPEVNKMVYSELDSIQTYKFIELLPQIGARLGSTRDINTNDYFSKAMYKLLMRCCIEHPYHTLPLILALANSYEDFEGKTKPEPEPRVIAARKMVEELQKHKSIGKLVNEMDRLSKALVSLAYVPVPDQNNPRGFAVPKDEKIRLMRNLQYAMLPIVHLPVQSDAKYSNIISIHSFDSKYLIAGGVNKPKKIVCIGSDGIKRLLLVKGRDDLRQDAVMQQVFTIVNTLLQACPETKRRRLKIRTYKIVPLSQRCGVLEWCQNTSPIQEVLLDVHSRYYPSDYKYTVCYKKIDKARLLSVNERLHVFKEICRNVHPAFRFFFTEKYPTPAEWFDHRLNYVHSVATNSMVGYILGLGDRHANNILIDKSTGELIHIDFGIAFEQGKVLPTPETVPFRLTRDIVDGMGISGVEGVFRRSCEKTIAVLRKNQEKIVTILEVLLYDPLYQWTITPKMAAKRQKDNSQESVASDSDDNVNTSQKNKMAVRVLCRLKEKLQGTEEGPASSIEGQVNRLIQQARDLGNLSRLFKGWQAYL